MLRALLAVALLASSFSPIASATIFRECVDPQDEVVLWACVTVEDVTDICVESQIGKRIIAECFRPNIPALP